MHAKGVLEAAAKMNFFQHTSDGFSKLIEARKESALLTSLVYSPPLVCCCGQKQEDKEQGGAVAMKCAEPDLEIEKGLQELASREPVASSMTVQGPLTIHFSGALGGIACQVMVDKGFVQCRLRAVAAPARSRLKCLRGKLAKGLAQKGMTLEGFQVTP